ncbi:MAG: hypothetical protein TEF_01100 [Rhizobiales bacterium NRL2]|nr:MAG: hypothetical protein TEF_01100 [Rhizobiales bacterium NRL2]
MPLLRSVLTAAVAAALLSACAELGLRESAPAAPEARKAPITRSDDLRAALDARKRRQAALPAVVTASPDTGGDDLPDVTPAALLGAEAGQVRGWLGRPALDWREGEHAMWQYVTDDCVIHLFVNGRNLIEDVSLGRRDGQGAEGCEHAIAERLMTAKRQG